MQKKGGSFRKILGEVELLGEPIKHGKMEDKK